MFWIIWVILYLVLESIKFSSPKELSDISNSATAKAFQIGKTKYNKAPKNVRLLTETFARELTVFSVSSVKLSPNFEMFLLFYVMNCCCATYRHFWQRRLSSSSFDICSRTKMTQEEKEEPTELCFALKNPKKNQNRHWMKHSLKS